MCPIILIIKLPIRLLASEVGIVDSGEKKKQKTLTKADQIKKVKKEQKLRELQIKLNFDGGNSEPWSGWDAQHPYEDEWDNINLSEIGEGEYIDNNNLDDNFVIDQNNDIILLKQVEQEVDNYPINLPRSREDSNSINAEGEEISEDEELYYARKNSLNEIIKKHKNAKRRVSLVGISLQDRLKELEIRQNEFQQLNNLPPQRPSQQLPQQEGEKIQQNSNNNNSNNYPPQRPSLPPQENTQPQPQQQSQPPQRPSQLLPQEEKLQQKHDLTNSRSNILRQSQINQEQLQNDEQNKQIQKQELTNSGSHILVTKLQGELMQQEQQQNQKQQHEHIQKQELTNSGSNILVTRLSKDVTNQTLNRDSGKRRIALGSDGVRVRSVILTEPISIDSELSNNLDTNGREKRGKTIDNTTDTEGEGNNTTFLNASPSKQLLKRRKSNQTNTYRLDNSNSDIHRKLFDSCDDVNINNSGNIEGNNSNTNENNNNNEVKEVIDNNDNTNNNFHEKKPSKSAPDSTDLHNSGSNRDRSLSKNFSMPNLLKSSSRFSEKRIEKKGGRRFNLTELNTQNIDISESENNLQKTESDSSLPSKSWNKLTPRRTEKREKKQIQISLQQSEFDSTSSRGNNNSNNNTNSNMNTNENQQTISSTNDTNEDNKEEDKEAVKLRRKSSRRNSTMKGSKSLNTIHPNEYSSNKRENNNSEKQEKSSLRISLKELITINIEDNTQSPTESNNIEDKNFTTLPPLPDIPSSPRKDKRMKKYARPKSEKSPSRRDQGKYSTFHFDNNLSVNNNNQNEEQKEYIKTSPRNPHKFFLAFHHSPRSNNNTNSNNNSNNNNGSNITTQGMNEKQTATHFSSDTTKISPGREREKNRTISFGLSKSRETSPHDSSNNSNNSNPPNSESISTSPRSASSPRFSQEQRDGSITPRSRTYTSGFIKHDI